MGVISWKKCQAKLRSTAKQPSRVFKKINLVKQDFDYSDFEIELFLMCSMSENLHLNKSTIVYVNQFG